MCFCVSEIHLSGGKPDLDSNHVTIAIRRSNQSTKQHCAGIFGHQRCLRRLLPSGSHELLLQTLLTFQQTVSTTFVAFEFSQDAKFISSVNGILQEKQMQTAIRYSIRLFFVYLSFIVSFNYNFVLYQFSLVFHFDLKLVCLFFFLVYHFMFHIFLSHYVFFCESYLLHIYHTYSSCATGMCLCFPSPFCKQLSAECLFKKTTNFHSNRLKVIATKRIAMPYAHRCT